MWQCPGFSQTPYFQRLDNYARRYGVTLSTAMAEDDFLVEAARWAEYYDRVREIVGQVTAARLADAPPREILDDPAAFRNWAEQCKRIHEARFKP